MIVFTPPGILVIAYELTKDARPNVMKMESRRKKGMVRPLTLSCEDFKLRKQGE